MLNDRQSITSFKYAYTFWNTINNQHTKEVEEYNSNFEHADRDRHNSVDDKSLQKWHGLSHWCIKK